jgi:hypothetical protein
VSMQQQQQQQQQHAACGNVSHRFVAVPSDLNSTCRGAVLCSETGMGLPAHHHQITKLSHSINAIGPAPHRSGRNGIACCVHPASTAAKAMSCAAYSQVAFNLTRN